ncbi:MAG: cell wall hydrolase [Oscillospiraceae bacterium]|nr:cell wall hydrolase [Oscillospiraceae bacterium]
MSIGADDQQRLMKIAYAEARSEGVECMALIMCVILNRVESDSFPDTVDGVITQSGQFTPVSNGSYASATPDEATRVALDLVLDGWDDSMGALYFESCDGESWHSQNLIYLFSRESIRFYR